MPSLTTRRRGAVTNRSRERTVKWPTKFEALQQGRVLNTRAFGPLAQCARLSIAGQQAIVAFVVGLLIASRPTHVARLVIAVVVRIAVQCVTWRWTWTHVTQKCFKRRAPVRADLNASAAVMRPVWTVRIMATDICVTPSPIFSRPLSARMTVPQLKRLLAFAKPVRWLAQTSAGPRSAAAQVIQLHRRVAAAITSAREHAVFASLWQLAQDDQSLKSLTDFDNAARHGRVNYTAWKAA